MSEQDTSANSEPSGSPSREPRSTSVLPLPATDECFSPQHYDGIRAIVEPIFLKQTARFPCLESEAPLDDIVDRVLERALKAGPIKSPIGFVARMAHRLCIDVGRKIERRQRWIAWRELAFDADDYASIPTLPVGEIEFERELAEDVLKTLVWAMPEINPTAAAVIAHWRSHASQEQLSLESLSVAAGLDYAQVRRIHRTWVRNFHVPSSALEPLAWLLREHPLLPLSHLHYYFAAGCNYSRDWERFGFEIQALYTVALRNPSELRSSIDHLRAKASKNSGRSPKEWRATEEGYLKNLTLATETLNRLTEQF